MFSLTVDAVDRRVLAAHRYGWKPGEVVAMAALPVVSVSIAWNALGGFAVGSPLWWAVAAAGPALSAFLFVVARRRKSGSRLELADEGGVWRLYRGGDTDGSFGTYVHRAAVNTAGVSTDEYTGRAVVLLSVVGDNGLTAESLELPQRLLMMSPELCVEVGLAAAEASNDAAAAVADVLTDIAGAR